MRARLTCLIAAVALLGACSGDGEVSPPGATRTPSSGIVAPTTTTAPPAVAPALDVAVLADDLDHPWDVAQAPDGTLLVDERGGGLTAVLPDGTVQDVAADFGDLFATGETGLMGLVLDPAFQQNRRFYTCQGRQDGGGRSIAVVAWTVDPAWRTATRVADPLLGGIPVNERSGRHGGCRLRFDPTGAMLVGTGDNAVSENPQDLGTLAGKVLRIDAATGAPAAGNPFADRSGVAAYLWTYGHRNVQGLAVRPGGGEVFAAEQGTAVDDEVTLLESGGNGGYRPGPGYDERVPMTDPALPDVLPATWASGDPTIATCGVTFLEGSQWQAYEGLLLIGVLKDRGVLALRVADDGALLEQFRLPELEGRYGRIRTVQQGVDGALYVTTDNGDDADQLLRVTPRP
ncbi:PQQ-dependent sugar dehydrogenase [Geodermatophilus sabuli]|uniref:Glucose/arabinose dehydrogenase, beta-propeller fold n=1 Tax=Geodermatophilus sabuli TaxID=1564158 RepID=A0A285E9C8_9ACTN|nr:PQQ-dependent sugar dehydrogenase [Geodermatophilus sabuli]MBB3084957.1 glucose/arabinose dehydrogenase [Geodermatophilus sabuli]SNX95635.1 Glucose/arabinose dehydrogenase, beta-propeller fold [Geodermatophilus sabuli]